MSSGNEVVNAPFNIGEAYGNIIYLSIPAGNCGGENSTCSGITITAGVASISA